MKWHNTARTAQLLLMLHVVSLLRVQQVSARVVHALITSRPKRRYDRCSDDTMEYCGTIMATDDCCEPRLDSRIRS